jgi:hypothetical protein
VRVLQIKGSRSSDRSRESLGVRISKWPPVPVTHTASKKDMSCHTTTSVSVNPAGRAYKPSPCPRSPATNTASISLCLAGERFLPLRLLLFSGHGGHEAQGRRAAVPPLPLPPSVPCTASSSVHGAEPLPPCRLPAAFPRRPQLPVPATHRPRSPTRLRLSCATACPGAGDCPWQGCTTAAVVAESASGLPFHPHPQGCPLAASEAAGRDGGFSQQG